jgi:cobalt-precorrin 5A hydrolase
MTSSNTTAIIAISRRGTALALRLSDALEGQAALYIERRFAGEPAPGVTAFELPLRSVIGQIFVEYRRLVLFMPVGAAVRLLAPHLGGKRTDPAVVCVDDAGRFAVSLLSGHKGGADALAQEVAKALCAMPVITSASHVLGTLAVDMLGGEFGWRIEADPIAVTRASAAVVNGAPVAVFQDAGERNWRPDDTPLPCNICVFDSWEALAKYHASAYLLITDRLVDTAALKDRPIVIYRPRSLVLGMGCCRGVPLEELERLLHETFTARGLAIASIRCIATADVKRDEEGMKALTEKLGAPLICYSAEQINSRPGPSGPSAAYERLGLIGVSEPAALLASGNDSLIVSRVKSASATLAVARMVFTE